MGVNKLQAKFGVESPTASRYDSLMTPSMVGCLGPGSQALPVYRGPKNPRAGISIAWPEYAVMPLSRPIETFNVQTCAVLGIIDKQGGQHYLGHFTRALAPDTIQTHLATLAGRHRLNLATSQLYLVPGSWPSTGETVSAILQALEALDPALPRRVAFRHYPAEEFPNTGSIVSYGGVLACTLPQKGMTLFPPGRLGEERFMLTPSLSLEA